MAHPCQDINHRKVFTSCITAFCLAAPQVLTSISISLFNDHGYSLTAVLGVVISYQTTEPTYYTILGGSHSYFEPRPKKG